MAYRRTTAIVVIGWLYLLTGAVMLIAPFFAFQGAGGFGVNAVVLFPLGGIVLAAGIGLLRGAAWAWVLTALIALSGAVVTAARLWTGGAPEGLVPAFVTNVITLLVLSLARAPAAGRSADPP